MCVFGENDLDIWDMANPACETNIKLRRLYILFVLLIYPTHHTPPVIIPPGTPDQKDCSAYLIANTEQPTFRHTRSYIPLTHARVVALLTKHGASGDSK
jgi:hypothetical protein